MTCYFVRHGAAIAPGEWRGSDFDRPLTEKGRENTARVGRRLAKLGIRLERIVSSPLLRALQTASILASALDAEDRVVEDVRLADGFSPSRLAEMLRDRASGETIMFVGHEPTMSATAGQIVGGASIDFKKGAIACVELTDARAPAGTLRWLAPPKLLGA
jgi:phosphohistidine phosphatase